MSVQLKHRALVENCLETMWNKGLQQSIQIVAPGSLVILREKDVLDFDKDYRYYLRIVYAHNKTQTKCGLLIDDDRHEFNCLIDHDETCVQLIPFY